MAKINTAILLSGRGSNAAALLAAAQAPDYPARIGLVISNIAQAPGLRLAEAAGVETLTIPHAAFPNDRAGHEHAIDDALRARGTRLICLAGYMRLFTPWFTERWQGRMLNIHPSLLPALPGLNTHARALNAGHTRHGCTVHLVTSEMDAGPILGQSVIPVEQDDTPATLAARVLQAEHQLYPACLRRFSDEMGG